MIYTKKSIEVNRQYNRAMLHRKDLRVSMWLEFVAERQAIRNAIVREVELIVEKRLKTRAVYRMLVRFVTKFT